MNEVAQLTYDQCVNRHTCMGADGSQGEFRRGHGDDGQTPERQGKELASRIQGEALVLRRSLMIRL